MRINGVIVSRFFRVDDLSAHAVKILASMREIDEDARNLSVISRESLLL